MDSNIITDEDIQALKDGKCLYTDNGEYAHIISYIPSVEGKDNDNDENEE